MREYGLDAFALVQATERALNTDLRICREDLAQVQVDALPSEAKAEDL
jgi:hypothetical protein